VPYALWWLVMIETVALAAEEEQQPYRTIPRGLARAQLSLIVRVLLSWCFARGAVDSQAIAAAAKGDHISDPLAEVIRRIPAGKSPALVLSFGTIALFGLIASYHGMIYGTSRQAFALGRAGYLPRFLGDVHQERRTPVPALGACSLVSAGFVVSYFWFKDAINIAVLVSTLTALVWYILAMVCLFLLRRREPHLFSAYTTPLPRLLPALVIVLSAFAAYVYSGIEHGKHVLWLTIGLYAFGLGYYCFWARARLQAAAPEELAAQQARPVDQEGLSGTQRPPVTTGAKASLLEWITAITLLAVMLCLAWIVLVAQQTDDPRVFPVAVEIIVILALLLCALFLVGALALRHTRLHRHLGDRSPPP